MGLFSRALQFLPGVLLLALGASGNFQNYSGGAPVERAQAAESPVFVQPFDQAAEFPNLFLPEAYRNLPPDKIPADVLATQTRLVESALKSIYSRLTMTVVNEQGAFETVRYFPHLMKKLRKIDSTVHVHAAGGVVRAALSYLYDQLYQEMQRHPGVKAEEMLARIARETHDIAGLDVRGVGSDWDVFLTGDPAKLDELTKEAKRVTHSVERKVGLKSLGESGMKRALIVRGDFKDLAKQTERSSLQGGSAVDLLAFDVESGHLSPPPRYPQVVKDLIAGYWEYLPPVASGEALEAPQSTIVRGIRPYLELPFLRLKNESYFHSQLKGLLQQKEADGKVALPDKSKEQFAKMVRNSRWSGAHNRFYRLKPDTVEDTVMQLSAQISSERSPAIPRFVDRFTIKDRKIAASLVDEFLIPLDEFIAQDTNGGWLYHGTPDMEKGLAILRGGMFVSSTEQGAANYGRGGYATPKLDTAQSYARGNGMVLHLKLKSDPGIRILDMEKLKKSGKLGEIEADARAHGMDPNEWLAKRYNIDLIKNEHILVQNTDVFEATNIKSLITTLANSTENSEMTYVARVQALKAYRELYEYGAGVGEAELASPAEKFRSIAKPYIEEVAADIEHLDQNLPKVYEWADEAPEGALQLASRHLEKVSLKPEAKVQILFKYGELHDKVTPEARAGVRSTDELMHAVLPPMIEEINNRYSWMEGEELMELLFSRREADPQFVAKTMGDVLQGKARLSLKARALEWMARYREVYGKVPIGQRAELIAPKVLRYQVLWNVLLSWTKFMDEGTFEAVAKVFPEFRTDQLKQSLRAAAASEFRSVDPDLARGLLAHQEISLKSGAWTEVTNTLRISKEWAELEPEKVLNAVASVIQEGRLPGDSERKWIREYRELLNRVPPKFRVKAVPYEKLDRLGLVRTMMEGSRPVLDTLLRSEFPHLPAHVLDALIDEASYHLNYPPISTNLNAVLKTLRPPLDPRLAAVLADYQEAVLSKALQSDNAQAKAFLIRKIGRTGDLSPAVAKQLNEALARENSIEIVGAVAEVLSEKSPQSLHASPQLLQALQTQVEAQSKYDRPSPMTILMQVGGDDLASVRKVVEKARATPDLMPKAFEALAYSRGTDARAVVVDFVREMVDSARPQDAEALGKALLALADLDPAHPSLLPGWKKLVNSQYCSPDNQYKLYARLAPLDPAYTEALREVTLRIDHPYRRKSFESLLKSAPSCQRAYSQL